MSGSLIGAPTTVAREVERSLPSTGKVVSADPLGKGYSNESWLVETEQGRLLAKIAVRFPDGQRLKNAVAGSKFAQQSGLPTPTYLHADYHCGAFGGRPFAVSEFIEGTDGEDMLQHLDEPARALFFAEWGSAIACLHAVGGPGYGTDLIGGPSYTGWADWIETPIRCGMRGAGIHGDAPKTRGEGEPVSPRATGVGGDYPNSRRWNHPAGRGQTGEKAVS